MTLAIYNPEAEETDRLYEPEERHRSKDDFLEVPRIGRKGIYQRWFHFKIDGKWEFFWPVWYRPDDSHEWDKLYDHPKANHLADTTGEVKGILTDGTTIRVPMRCVATLAHTNMVTTRDQRDMIRRVRPR